MLRRERLQGAGLDLALPYLLLAPSVLIVLAVLVYPLWDGLRASTKFYRYGKPLRDIGLSRAWPGIHVPVLLYPTISPAGLIASAWLENLLSSRDQFRHNAVLPDKGAIPTCPHYLAL